MVVNPVAIMLVKIVVWTAGDPAKLLVISVCCIKPLIEPTGLFLGDSMSEIERQPLGDSMSEIERQPLGPFDAARHWMLAGLEQLEPLLVLGLTYQIGRASCRERV